MKKLFFALAIFTVIVLIGCNDNKLTDIKDQVNELQDSLKTVIDQHDALMDSVTDILATLNKDETDINALKMSQIGSLFESIARQPEAYKSLISATEMLYTDYTELSPFSDSTIVARGKTLGELFNAIARQPEAFHFLDSAATKYTGKYELLNIEHNKADSKARGIALGSLFYSIARQPEAFHDLDSAATKYVGIYNSAYFSEQLLGISKAYALQDLNESLARQPEADSLFNLVCKKYLNFTFIDYPENTPSEAK